METMTDWRSRLFWDNALVALVALYVLGLGIHGVTWMEKWGLIGSVFITLTGGRWRAGLDLMRHPLLLMLLCLVGWLACSTLWSPDAAATAKAVTGAFKEYLLIFLPLAYLLGDMDRRRLFARLLALGGAVVVALNGIQYIDDLVTDPSRLNDILRHRDWAHPLVFHFPFALMQFRLSKGRESHGWAALIVLEIFMVVGSGARAAWLALFFEFALWALLAFDRRQILRWAGIGALVAGVGYLILPATIVKNRIDQGADTSLRTTGTWGPTLDMLKERPVLGYGFGSRVFNQEFNRRAASEENWSIKKSIGPHSVYLEVGFAAGVPGLIAILLLFAAAVAYGLRGVTGATSVDNRLLALAVTASFVGFYVTRGAFASLRWSPLIIHLVLIAYLSRLAGNRNGG